MGVPVIVDFGRALRMAGLPVGTGRLATLAEALTHVPDRLYWAGRATLVGRHDDIQVYDRVFAEVFGEDPPSPHPNVLRRHDHLQGVRASQGIAGGDHDVEVADDRTNASDRERLRTRSFATLDASELRQLSASIDRLRLVAPVRRSRRRVRSRRGALDHRRTVRMALRTGGDPVRLVRRDRVTRRRRIVLLLDISGSMSAYSRALLVFAHAALRADQRWDAFTFGTRLTRLSGVLRAADADEAIARAAAAARDWDGGTRIGESIRELLDRYGSGATIRGAVVVILSDGLDVGDTDILAAQMARLSRLAHRVVWLNPLQENPAYQPLARGMATSLPHVDLFASGHNLADLEQTCRAIGNL